MGQDAPADVSYGTVEPPPCKRPLEVLERDGEWAVREYHEADEPVEGGVATYGTYDSRIDAMRDGKAVMEARRHPCLLRWDTPQSVGGLYWNPAFETLSVEYSPLLQAWVVTPQDGHFVFQAVDATKTAYQLGKLVLEQYDFRRVEYYSRNDEKQGEREHRFLRHGITDSGVRFNRGRLPTSVERPAPPPDGSGSEETGTTDAPDAEAVLHTLASAVPDITSLEPLDTDGAVYTYRTPWDDGTANVWILNPEYTDHRTLRHAFGEAVDDWDTLSEAASVTSVHETGGDPATWVLFDVSDPTLADRRDDLSTDQRLAVLASVGEAMGAARRQEVYRTGLRPERVRVGTDEAGGEPLSPTDDEPAAHVSGLGVRRRVSEALDRYDASRYMAPEQLRQAVAPTTPVYRLGALAYWLLTGTEPFHDRQDFTTALEDGDLTSPEELAALPAGASEAILTATSTDPGERYGTPAEFVRRLLGAFE